MRIEKNTENEFVSITDLNVGDTFYYHDCNGKDILKDILYLIVDNGACGSVIFDEFESTKNNYVYCVNLKSNTLCRFCLDTNVIKVESKIVVNR